MPSAWRSLDLPHFPFRQESGCAGGGLQVHSRETPAALRGEPQPRLRPREHVFGVKVRARRRRSGSGAGAANADSALSETKCPGPARQQQHPESCATARIYSRARPVWVFSLHLALDWAPGWQESVLGGARARPRRDPVPVTCGARPAVPDASVHAKDKKLASLPTPREDGHDKKGSAPSSPYGPGCGAFSGRRSERQSAEGESCIRNFLLQTARLLSHFHGWRRLIREPSESGLGPSGG